MKPLPPGLNGRAEEIKIKAGIVYSQPLAYSNGLMHGSEQIN